MGASENVWRPRTLPRFLASCAAMHAMGLAPAQQITVNPPVELGFGGAETHIAVNPCDPLHAIGVWMHDISQVPAPEMARTADGGQTWTALSFSGHRIDPTIAFHPFGQYAYNAAMGGQCSSGAFPDNSLRRIDGTEVSEASLVFDGPNGEDEPCSVDRTAVAAARTATSQTGPIQLYYAYTFTPTGQIGFKRADSQDASTNATWPLDLTWSDPQVFVSPSGQIPVLAVGPDPDRAVHVGFVGGGALAFVRHSFSANDGETWTTSLVSDEGTRLLFNGIVAGEFRVPAMPGLGVDPKPNDGSVPNTGLVYVSYNAFDPGGNPDDSNLYVSKGSPDGSGAYVWQLRVAASEFNPPACPNPEHHLDQFFSNITVDDRGWVHVVWQEACDVGPGPNAQVFTVYACSTDGGQTFVRTVLNPNDPLLPGGSLFIGDYIGLACAGNKVYCLYPKGPVIGQADFDITVSRIDIGLNEADLDGSGVVNLTDYTTFCDCFRGEGNNPRSGCFYANLDTDCDVDCTDWCLFESIGGCADCPTCCPAPDCCGDFDGNGMIDLVDFATFSNCFGGSGGCNNPSCSAASFACADLTGNCVVDLNDYATFASRFGFPPPPDCEVPVVCGGSAGAQGGAPPPDVNALAEWTVANIPPAERQLLADRARHAASRSADAAEREALFAFAEAIQP